MSFSDVEDKLKEMKSALRPPFKVGQIVWNLTANQYCLVVGLWEADSTDAEPGWEIVVRSQNKPDVNRCCYPHELSPVPPEYDPTFPYEEERDKIAITWCVDDVISVCQDKGKDISPEDARQLLGYAANKHDPELGLSHDVIWVHAQELKSLGLIKLVDPA